MSPHLLLRLSSLSAAAFLTVSPALSDVLVSRTYDNVYVVNTRDLGDGTFQVEARRENTRLTPRELRGEPTHFTRIVHCSGTPSVTIKDRPVKGQEENVKIEGTKWASTRTHITRASSEFFPPAMSIHDYNIWWFVCRGINEKYGQ